MVMGGAKSRESCFHAMKRLPIETFLGHFLKHPAALVGSKVSGILFLNTLSPAIVVDDRFFGKT